MPNWDCKTRKNRQGEIRTVLTESLERWMKRERERNLEAQMSVGKKLGTEKCSKD